MSLVNCRDLPPNKAFRLNNLTCIYCGRRFGKALKATKEHVIGRRFVPGGVLENSWNLIAKACRDCNLAKSQLEDDISAITMQPDIQGRFALEDARLHEEAKRKGVGARSQRTKKAVHKSQEEVIMSGEVAPGLSATLKMICGPQIEPERAFALARYHVGAFFYWLTFDAGTRIGGFWIGHFMPIALVQKQDWGNVQMLGFQDLINGWLHRVFCVGGDGFFKMVIRRHSDELSVWAWALEWNQNHRLIGLFGDSKCASPFAEGLPRLSCRAISTGQDNRWLFRIETPLADKDDRLFIPYQPLTTISSPRTSL